MTGQCPCRDNYRNIFSVRVVLFFEPKNKSLTNEHFNKISPKKAVSVAVDYGLCDLDTNFQLDLLLKSSRL